jgi:CRISPR-associated protein Cmr4
MTMKLNYSYLFLLAPLHTGGATQEGNLLGIAREVHTELPYIPSSTIRGRLRASIEDQGIRDQLFGKSLKSEKKSDRTDGYGELTQGDIWISDGSLLWIPVSSLSHGVIWVSSPLLLRRWAKFQAGKTGATLTVPPEYSTSLGASKPVYLKDAILKANDLKAWSNWKDFVPAGEATGDIDRVLVLPDRHFKTLVQMALARQVKIKLDEEKSVDGGFRYEEAIPRDTLMYFPWGLTSQAIAKSDPHGSEQTFSALLDDWDVLQIGGQESLGRGFVQQWREQ